MSNDGYRALQRYRQHFMPGETVYEQGTVPTAFFVLISGRVVFEVLDSLGARTTVGEVLAGGSFGLVSTFSGRPTSAAARTTVRTEVLAIPVVEAVQAFAEAPGIAVNIIRELANQRLAPPASAPNLDEIALEPEPPSLLPLNVLVDNDAPKAPPVDDAALVGPFNEQWFFRDEMQCPVCRNSFAYLRVRASAVRPASRDSDFRISYRTVDPSLYAVTVCPHCAYASYFEDFGEVKADEARALLAARAERIVQLTSSLGGERTLEEAMLSLRLALQCAETRGTGARRRAGLLHRLAWLERARDNAEAEQVLLLQARDGYIEVYQQDTDIQDAAAMRVAYLIGDLTLRLGEAATARRWLLECVGMRTADRQEGLLRMARQRLDEAREAQQDARVRSA